MSVILQDISCLCDGLGEYIIAGYFDVGVNYYPVHHNVYEFQSKRAWCPLKS